MKLTIGTAGDGTPFRLPLELTTQSMAILAKRGVGKSYTAGVITEELLNAGQVPVIIDPTGAHWGIKAGAAGTAHAGFPVVVFGGEHADLPLEDTAGETIARAIVDQRFPAIIDLSLLRKGAVRRFMAAFLETLYRLNRLPLTLVVDEADDICPQKPFGDEAQMVGAMEDVVKRGRKKGLGCILITQRPADMAKQVLTQCEVLVAMRLVHPLDIKAVMEWVHVHADPVRAQEMVKSLPSLPVGTAWFWSPGFGDIFEQVKIRSRLTFDSGATPTPGEKLAQPKKMAQADLTKLGNEITQAAQRAKENDPAALRSQVTGLKKTVADMQALLDKPAKAQELRVEVPVLTEANVKALDAMAAKLTTLGEQVAGMDDALTDLLAAVAKKLDAFKPKAAPAPFNRATDGVLPRATLQVQTPAAVKYTPAEPGAIGGGKRRILIALAQFPQGLGSRKLALLTGLKASGGTWRNYLGELRGAGLVIGGSDHMRITPEGITTLGAYEPLPTGEGLRAYWQLRLGEGGKRRIFDVACNAYPVALSYAAVAEECGIEASGGTWRNYLGELRGLDLITGKGEIRASDELFQE